MAKDIEKLLAVIGVAKKMISSGIESPLEIMKVTKEKVINAGAIDAMTQSREIKVRDALNGNIQVITTLKQDLDSKLEIIKEVAKREGLSLSQGEALEQAQMRGRGF